MVLRRTQIRRLSRHTSTIRQRRPNHSSNIATSQTVTGYSIGFHHNYGGTGWSTTASNAYWDDVVIDDAYIGPIGVSGVFSDGFESNNFSAWSWTEGSPSTQSSIKHDGNYALAYAGSSNVYAAKDLGTAYSTLYVREYVYVQFFPAQWNVFSVLCSRDASYGTGADVVVYNDGGIQKFALSTSSGWISSSATVSANIWYCVELRLVAGSGNGVVELFVDGQSVLYSLTQTVDPIRYVYAGSIWSGTSCTAYIDSFAANTTYIGT